MDIKVTKSVTGYTLFIDGHVACYPANLGALNKVLLLLEQKPFSENSWLSL